MKNFGVFCLLPGVALAAQTSPSIIIPTNIHITSGPRVTPLSSVDERANRPGRQAKVGHAPDLKDFVARNSVPGGQEASSEPRAMYVEPATAGSWVDQRLVVTAPLSHRSDGEAVLGTGEDAFVVVGAVQGRSTEPGMLRSYVSHKDDVAETPVVRAIATLVQSGRVAPRDVTGMEEAMAVDAVYTKTDADTVPGERAAFPYRYKMLVADPMRARFAREGGKQSSALSSNVPATGAMPGAPYLTETHRYMSNPCNMQNPGDNVQNPGDNVQNPGDNVQNPGDNVQNPGNNVQNPGNNVQNPGNNVQNPGNNAQNPGNNVQNPGNNVQNPGNNFMWNPGNSYMWNPGNNYMWNPGNMWGTGSNLQNPGFAFIPGAYAPQGYQVELSGISQRVNGQNNKQQPRQDRVVLMQEMIPESESKQLDISMSKSKVKATLTDEGFYVIPADVPPESNQPANTNISGNNMQGVPEDMLQADDIQRSLKKKSSGENPTIYIVPTQPTKQPSPMPIFIAAPQVYQQPRQYGKSGYMSAYGMPVPYGMMAQPQAVEPGTGIYGLSIEESESSPMLFVEPGEDMRTLGKKKAPREVTVAPANSQHAVSPPLKMAPPRVYYVVPGPPSKNGNRRLGEMSEYETVEGSTLSAGTTQGQPDSLVPGYGEFVSESDTEQADAIHEDVIDNEVSNDVGNENGAYDSSEANENDKSADNENIVETADAYNTDKDKQTQGEPAAKDNADVTTETGGEVNDVQGQQKETGEQGIIEAEETERCLGKKHSSGSQIAYAVPVPTKTTVTPVPVKRPPPHVVYLASPRRKGSNTPVVSAVESKKVIKIEAARLPLLRRQKTAEKDHGDWTVEQTHL